MYNGVDVALMYVYEDIKLNDFCGSGKQRENDIFQLVFI